MRNDPPALPIQSSRFRTRKINYKTAIPIFVGDLEGPFDEDQELAAVLRASSAAAAAAAAAAATEASGPSSSSQ